VCYKAARRRVITPAFKPLLPIAYTSGTISHYYVVSLQPSKTGNFIHIVVTFKAGNGPEKGRLTVYVNGEQKGQRVVKGNFL